MEKNTCPSCGASYSKAKKYCSYCGTQLNEGIEEPPNTSTIAKSPAVVEKKQGISGLAITSLVTFLFGIFLVSLVLSIIELNRINKGLSGSKGKTLSVIIIILSIVIPIIILIVVAANFGLDI